MGEIEMNETFDLPERHFGLRWPVRGALQLFKQTQLKKGRFMNNAHTWERS
jgi:hypothetical protein